MTITEFICVISHYSRLRAKSKCAAPVVDVCRCVMKVNLYSEHLFSRHMKKFEKVEKAFLIVCHFLYSVYVYLLYNTESKLRYQY